MSGLYGKMGKQCVGISDTRGRCSKGVTPRCKAPVFGPVVVDDRGQVPGSRDHAWANLKIHTTSRCGLPREAERTTAAGIKLAG